MMIVSFWCRLSVAGDDGGRSCRAAEGATPLQNKLGYIELNWDDSAGHGGHVTTGACRWMIIAERGQRINLTLYHFGQRPSTSSRSRWEPVIRRRLSHRRATLRLAIRPSVCLFVFATQASNVRREYHVKFRVTVTYRMSRRVSFFHWHILRKKFVITYLLNISAEVLYVDSFSTSGINFAIFEIKPKVFL